MGKYRAFLAISIVAAMAAGSIEAMASGAVVSAPDKSVLFWSVHKPSGRYALHRAMEDCNAHFGGGCFVEKVYDYGCIAVARSNSHRRWGYAWRETADAASEAAMERCDETGSHSCSVQTTTCE
jgi:hypothetical protein